MSKGDDEVLAAGVACLILLLMTTTNRPPIVMGTGWVWPVPPMDAQSDPAAGDVLIQHYNPVITQGVSSAHQGVDMMYQRASAIDRLRWPPDTTDSQGARQHASKKGARWFAPEETPIISANDGVVRLVRFINGYGTWVMIDHGPEFTSSYSHLRDPLVKQGERVKAGQKIATMGHAELDGEKLRHLHFELWSRAAGGRIDPAKVMPQWKRGDTWTA